MNEAEDKPLRYTIRVYEHATRDINEAIIYLADSVSQNTPTSGKGD